jgi:hypothetical protein
MSQFITGESLKRSAKEYKAAIREMLTEIQRNNEKMARDQVEIEILRNRTNETLARIFARLNAA